MGASVRDRGCRTIRRLRALQIGGGVSLILPDLTLVISVTGGSYVFGAAALTLGLIGGFSIYTLMQKERE